MKKYGFLFFIIFLEGYIVLSTELLAIRQTLPFVGSGTDTVSIIIAAVLMPLAAGYYYGGRYRPRKNKKGSYSTIRDKLLRNLIISGIILTFGLSYYIVNGFFETLIGDLEWRNRHFLITLYTILFIVTPVYLLGQTVPLISNYFSRTRISEAAGKILFFSTLGSFAGAVFSTLFLMNTIGVSGTASVSMACITLLVFVLSKKKLSKNTIAATALLAIALFLNSPQTLAKLNVVHSNAYSTVQIGEYGSKRIVRIFRLNKSPSSVIFIDNPEEPLAPYRHFIETYFTNTLQRTKPGDILILGAGGFTMGLNDRRNQYTFVDIDPDLQNIAETYFLGQKLKPNQKFVAQPARSFLIESNKKYDIIIMDVTSGVTGTPDHLVTLEFFELLKAHLKDDSLLFINTSASALFEDDYSKNLDNTIRQAFPYINRQIADPVKSWHSNEKHFYNGVLYYGRITEQPETLKIYTDDKNSAPIDKKLSARP